MESPPTNFNKVFIWLFGFPVAVIVICFVYNILTYSPYPMFQKIYEYEVEGVKGDKFLVNTIINTFPDPEYSNDILDTDGNKIISIETTQSKYEETLKLELIYEDDQYTSFKRSFGKFKYWSKLIVVKFT